MLLLKKNTLGCFWAALTFLVVLAMEPASGQESALRYGRGVPAAVRVINDRCLTYLASTQGEDGSWPGQGSGPGITGICVMAFMASGEDPDFGPYAAHIRKALRHIIVNQSAKTGHVSGPGHGPMYHHGFAAARHAGCFRDSVFCVATPRRCRLKTPASTLSSPT